MREKVEMLETVTRTPAGGLTSPSLSNLLQHPLVFRLLSLAIVLSAWEWAGRVPISPSFPTFSETLSAMLEMIGDGTLQSALVVTLVPLGMGVAISAVIGVSIGVVMGLDTRAEWLGVPVFIVLQAAPLAALIPLLVLAYGIGLATKVLIVCIMSMPVIVLNSFKAIRHAPVSLIDMGRAFLGTRRQLIAKIILPSAAPVIFAGLRLGTAAGFVGAILAELLVTPTGIGDIITYNQSIAEYPKMYGAIATVIVLSVCCVESLEWAERRFFRPEKRGQA